ncbi:DUF2059 domain-containing protein [Roseobacter weihaiensis]|uniref:DUF2059 domain-containing protein n=1 Tax=Roseobacter weihaiensis TaxID=2763262 RepID=UPI001D0A48A9|nr:DUF2059 domain-containing protein [Roseobacter sp. H9]
MRALCLAICLSVSALPAWANARVTLLMDALKVTEVVSILRAEGLSYAQTLDADMLNGQGGAFWTSQVDRIYDAERIEETVRAALEAGLEEEEIEAALAFFTSERGTRIVRLENAARTAMADPEVDEAAREIYESLRDSDGPLVQLVSHYIDVNDLLERNVSGAMSANYQFYKGLSDGRFMRRSDADILDEVWAQQDDIRTDTESWLHGFLLMAYQPLPLEDMQAYVDYSASPEGQALNAALFEGFETVYRDLSYALGRAVALNAAGDEI